MQLPFDRSDHWTRISRLGGGLCLALYLLFLLYAYRDTSGFLFLDYANLPIHEAGHLFYMKKGQKFNWSEEPRSEEEAHWFALQLLKFNEIDAYEYYRFYEKAVKSVKKRKKSWFEI